MSNKELLNNRLVQLEQHFIAITDYYEYISIVVDFYDETLAKNLEVTDRAILDAYLTRFGSILDFLGTKIFPMLLTVAGINRSKMNEVLNQIEKEGIIDSFDNWVKLKGKRDDLENVYPKDLKEALTYLKFCIDSYSTLKMYYINTVNFANRYLDKSFKLN